MSSAPHISRHAIERYQQRVDPSASYLEAQLALTRFVTLGRHRPVPRWWMRGHVRTDPGVRFCYLSASPHLCAVLVEGVVVTVLTKSMFAASRRVSDHIRPAERVHRQPVNAADRARWRWNGETDSEAA